MVRDGDSYVDKNYFADLHLKAEPIAPSSLPGPLVKISPNAPTTSSPAPVPSEGNLTVNGIILATNKERVQHSDKALTESRKLDASAQVKANDILTRQYFEHTAPDGKTVSDLVVVQGYTYIKIGENLALGDFKSDTDVVTAWMNSPSHRANILDAAFTEIGVGVAHGMYQGHIVYVAVQHFGRPLSSCPTIDTGLKAEVEAGQKALADLSAYLESLKKAIDEGRAQGKDMNDTVAIYNAGVEKYQTDFAHVDALRTEYNNEVSAFNSCAAQ